MPQNPYQRVAKAGTFLPNLAETRRSSSPCATSTDQRIQNKAKHSENYASCGCKNAGAVQQQDNLAQSATLPDKTPWFVRQSGWRVMGRNAWLALFRQAGDI
jgi:hypothetical protein